jgi:hypothetical protein
MCFICCLVQELQLPLSLMHRVDIFKYFFCLYRISFMNVSSLTLCDCYLFQDVLKDTDRRSKLPLIESTKMCIRPVEQIITDELHHRERGSRV